MYYEQKRDGDQKLLLQLCRCFKLFYAEGQNVRDTYNGGLIRFGSTDGGTVLLVGSKTVYDKHRPANIQYLKLTALPEKVKSR